MKREASRAEVAEELTYKQKQNAVVSDAYRRETISNNPK